MISREEARRIAQDWHGGQFSPLYALVSSGTLTPGANAEVWDCLRDGTGAGDREDLSALAEWIEAHDRMTDYGHVMIQAEGVTIEADSSQLWEWANRPGHRWPCSELARLEGPLVAEFDSNGLLDLTGDGGPDSDLSGAELSAWATDCLRDVLPADHPAYAVAVGQFEEREAKP